ncbi:MAG: DNA alkylation repair protein [Pseudomonadota bacterium]
MMNIKTIQKKLHKLGNPENAKTLQRFFKTGPGEYAEGDVFWGIKVPEIRKVAKECQDIPGEAAAALLRSPVHEQRLLALFILIHKYKKEHENEKRRIFELYLENIQHVNNWDLVDGSAGHIVGAFLMDKSKTPLYRLAKSNNLWERRIAILATFHFIKHGELSETLIISKILLADKEDLIHKAVGWMLREVAKRDMLTAETFLKEHYHRMPRTMLRYAIERFEKSKRQNYLKGNI